MTIGRATLIELRFTVKSQSGRLGGELALDLIRLTMKFASWINTLKRISAQ